MLLLLCSLHVSEILQYTLQRAYLLSNRLFQTTASGVRMAFQFAGVSLGFAGVFRYAGQFQESLWGARPVGVVKCPRAPMAKSSTFDEGGGDRERRASQCHFLDVA
jgi:hypothetical protein